LNILSTISENGSIRDRKMQLNSWIVIINTGRSEQG
jgi:hypothetical protein